MKGNVIFEKFTTLEDGRIEYTMTKETKYGTFTGTVRTAKEDIKYFNKWSAYSLAEYKCDVQAQHEKVKRYRERMIEAKHIYTVLLDRFASNEIMEYIECQYKVAKRDYHIEKQKYYNLRNRYKDFADFIIEHRKKVIDQLDEDYKTAQQRKEKNEIDRAEAKKLGYID